jgi:TP901 family phage tail tape measure protein
MAIEVFNLNANITADTSGFTAGIQKAQSGLKNWGLDLNKFYDTGSGIFKKFGVDVDKFAGHFGMSGKLMSAIVACVTALVKLGQEMDEARAEIVKGTGAIGDALDDLEASAKQALVQGVGASVKQTGKLIADLNTRFGMTGKTLEKTAVEFGHFAKAAGVDLGNAVNNIADVMARWNVPMENSKDLMNQLTKASQISGASVDELVSAVNSGSVYFEQFGFNLTESIAMLSSFRKSGIQTSTVMTGLRTALSKFSKEGKDAKTAFAEVTKQIKSAENETEAMNIAVSTFGTRAGAEMFKAIRSGSASLEEFTGELRNAGYALDDTYDAVRTSKDAMADLKNSLKGTFGGLGQAFSALWKGILDGIREFVLFIEPIVTPIVEVFKKVFTKISEFISWFVKNLRECLQKSEVVYKSIIKITQEFGKLLSGVFGDLVGIIKNVFGFIFSVIGGDWEKAWLNAQLIFFRFARIISKICDFIANLFVNLINFVGDKINKGWVGWIKFTTEVYEKSGGMIDISGAGKQFSAIKKQMNDIYKDAKEADKAFSDVLSDWMKGTGLAFKPLDKVALEEIKGAYGVVGKSLNDMIDDAEKRLKELEKGYGDTIGDLPSTSGGFSGGLSGLESEKDADKTSTAWLEKRLQQQLDAITKEKEAKLNALREEGATQEQLDAINAVFAEKQIEKYNELQAIKKANDEKALGDVANIEEEKLHLQEYYADEAEKYRVDVTTNTVKAIEEIEKDSSEWTQKLLEQEIDAVSKKRKEEVEAAKNEKKSAKEIQDIQKKSIEYQISLYAELNEWKKKSALESAENAQETAEIERWYANDIANYIKELNSEIVTDTQEKTKSWWDTFTSVMGNVGSVIGKVMSTTVNIIKKGIDLAWKVMQINPDDILNNMLEIADTIQTFFIETLPQLPGMIDGILNIIEVLVDTITQPSVIQTLAETVEVVIVKIIDWVTKNIGKILSGAGKLVGAVIKGLISALTQINWVELIAEIFKGIFEGIGNVFSALFEALGNFFNEFGKLFARDNHSTEARIAKAALAILTAGVSLIFTGFAKGTNNADSGLHLVGEQGPELIDFHGGERVYTAQQTKGLLGGSSDGGNTFNVTFNNLNDTSAYTMMRQMKNWQRELAISRVL